MRLLRSPPPAHEVYDEYLAQGYPIATGAIEGDSRHLLKERMKRNGMKWTGIGARELPHLRCLQASGNWNEFHKQRSAPSQPENQLCG